MNYLHVIHALRRIEGHSSEATLAADAVNLAGLRTALSNIDDELRTLRAYVDGARAQRASDPEQDGR